MDKQLLIDDYGIMVAMNLDAIIVELTQERNRIDQALSALQQSSGNDPANRKRRGRPPGSGSKTVPVSSGPRKRRQMSAAARKKISDAAKRRWATRKAADKKAAS